jgi:hypothetical protein
VKPECALTENQSLDGEISGYLDFLSMRTEQKRMLVYLVPRHWFYLGSLTKSRDRLKRDARCNGVEVIIRHWEEILFLLERGEQENPDPLLREFQMLLAQKFGAVRFNVKELHMLQSREFLAAFQTVRKLEELIDEVREKAVEKGHAVEPEQEQDEYGFYLTRPNDKRALLLWVGVWAEPLRRFGARLCFGVDHNSRFWNPAVITAFPIICKRRKISPETMIFEDSTWSVGWISNSALVSTTHSVVDKVWEQLEPVIDALNRAAPDSKTMKGPQHG